MEIEDMILTPEEKASIVVKEELKANDSNSSSLESSKD